MRKFIYFIIFSVMILFTTKPCMAESNFKCSMLEEGVLTVEGEGKLEQKCFYDLDESIGEVKSIIVGEGITEIGPACFGVFSEVEEIELPSSLKTISQGGLSCRYDLKKVTFGENLEKLDKNAFRSCRQLETVILPDSVKEIGAYAFDGCTNLKKLVVPKSLKSWTKDITEECPSLKTIVNRSKITLRVDNCKGNRIWKVKGKKTTKIPKGKTGKSRGKRIPIRYKLLGGKKTGKLPTSYEYGTTVKIPFNVKKKGYTMLAWNFRDQMDDDGGYFFTHIGPDDTKVVLRPLWIKISITNPKKGTVDVTIDDSETYQDFGYYEVRYSENKDMSNAIEEDGRGGVFRGLKKGKTYYFQFRAYMQSDEVEDGEPGKWCGTKKITIKK